MSNYLIIGLGNPGEEYEGTRHNAGGMAVDFFHEQLQFPEWKLDGAAQALVSKEKVGKHSVELALPETFMNRSGNAVSFLLKARKIQPEMMIVVYDDIDLPLGTLKISFDRGSGGHRGIESIIKSIKTKAFIRIRIGVLPTTPTGKPRKPQGEEKIIKFLMGTFSKDEQVSLKKIFKKTNEAIEIILMEGREKAMNVFN